jgi:hypothetical protein
MNEDLVGLVLDDEDATKAAADALAAQNVGTRGDGEAQLALADEEMKPEYLAWIKANVNPKACAGTCQSVVRKMVAAFPELRRVPGYFGTFHQHWWVEDVDGRVIDPTRYQFPDEGKGGTYYGLPGYPLFPCFECGTTVYKVDFNPCCSAECKEGCREEPYYPGDPRVR